MITRDDKLEFLEGYEMSKRRERAISEKILELRERQASASAIKYTGMPKGTGTRDLSDYIVDLEDRIQRLLDVKRRTDEIGELLCDVMRRLDDDLMYYSLFYKHIRRMKVERIADKFGCSRSYAYKVYNQAVDDLPILPSDREKMCDLLKI